MEAIRKKLSSFPVLEEHKIHYLDNAATTQKPGCVITAAAEYYRKNNANPMRGLYGLSIAATEAYENAREHVARFIHAAGSEEIIITRNATESLNLVAYSYGSMALEKDDEIIVSIVEHHSNFLPWQQAAKRAGAKIVFFECEQDGSLSLDRFKSLLSERTKIVAMTALSNVFGRAYDIQAFAAAAMKRARYLSATAPRVSRICRWMCPCWMWIFWPFPATRCTPLWE